ncbi:MAG: hypothetical protein A2V51_05620 [Candidatus Dadabacteria bacterium RBG_19FT_COMBO_40_33]|nr:MAG: hypothetical protein A2V51_05620 [Candidatus Dadabacteria bacterium RBG_19FT_COMBO_40_33]
MLDLVFPKLCPFCESIEFNEKICDRCLKNISFIRDRSICLNCGVPFGYIARDIDTQGLADLGHAVFQETEHTIVDASRVHLFPIPEHLCGRCVQDEYYFERARSIAFYDGILKEILHKFKYQRKLNLGGVLSNIIIDNFPNDLGMQDLVIPVPLYIDKLRKREYNQSLVLAEKVAKYLRVSFDPYVLRRIRDTKPQFEIKSDIEKRRNVKGAFILREIENIKGKSILLVDDVFTSGSTINECTRVLLEADASRVQVVTLMRAV